MNYVERFVDRKLRRLAWKHMNFEESSFSKKQERKISQYRWIIMNSEGAILYDTKKSGYKGLADYPVVIEALEMIEPVEKKQIIRKKETVERRIVFTIDSQLHYFFPSEELEASCVF
jgi:hypothetical protein